MSSDDLKASTDKAADQATSAVRDAQNNVRATGAGAMKKASDLYGQAADQVRGLSDAIPASPSDAYRAGQQAYAQGSDTVARHVAKQPVEALLLAGAIGYLVGWATSRS